MPVRLAWPVSTQRESYYAARTWGVRAVNTRTHHKQHMYRKPTFILNKWDWNTLDVNSRSITRFRWSFWMTSSQNVTRNYRWYPMKIHRKHMDLSCYHCACWWGSAARCYAICSHSDARVCACRTGIWRVNKSWRTCVDIEWTQLLLHSNLSGSRVNIRNKWYETWNTDSSLSQHGGCKWPSGHMTNGLLLLGNLTQV